MHLDIYCHLSSFKVSCEKNIYIHFEKNIQSEMKTTPLPNFKYLMLCGALHNVVASVKMISVRDLRINAP